MVEIQATRMLHVKQWEGRGQGQAHGGKRLEEIAPCDPPVHANERLAEVTPARIGADFAW
jgi:hypothetical protein